jgi:predicted Rdx family selenoprotein
MTQHYCRDCQWRGRGEFSMSDARPDQLVSYCRRVSWGVSQLRSALPGVEMLEIWAGAVFVDSPACPPTRRRKAAHDGA